MKQARPTTMIVDFQGLATDADPRDLSGGAAEVQENLAVVVLGEMAVRRGIREVTFDAE